MHHENGEWDEEEEQSWAVTTTTGMCFISFISMHLIRGDLIEHGGYRVVVGNATEHSEGVTWGGGCGR